MKRHRSKTLLEALAELREAQIAFGRALLEAAPGRWLVAFIGWLARKIEGRP